MENFTINLPKHVAIIMDGNGRWARSHLLSKGFAHKKGAEVAIEITKHAKKIGVEYLTLYAFSSENWQRSEEEVTCLMDLFKYRLENNFEELIKDEIRVRFIGNRSKLSEDIRRLMERLENNSKQFKFTLIIAISYGSKDEIRQAAFDFAKNIQKNGIDPDSIDKGYFDRFFPTADIPDPDLLIRSGNEKRLSNFLLWQLSYTELYFIDKEWPSFSTTDLDLAIQEYNKRNRKYGK